MANPEHLKILKQGVEVWNRWREDDPETLPDLRGHGMIDMSLQDIDFSGANFGPRSWTLEDGTSCMKCGGFSHVDLRGSSLVNANLTGVCIQYTDLSGANLMDSILKEAHLIHSKLTYANLAGVLFEDTLFIEADLQRALVGGTCFVSVDLSEVNGLETLEHVDRSDISIGTLYRTRGRIPEEFLRNAGVEQEFIENTRGLFHLPISFYSAFISYSHSDRIFAHRLHDQLQARGIRCWLDEHDLKPGDRILDVVDDAIRRHDKILLCCSETSLNSWWVKDEIRKAHERERLEGRDIIIPLMVDRYLLDGWKDGLAADLRSRIAADFTGWENDNAKFEEQFERVVTALRTDEAAREKAPKPKL